MNNKRTLVKLYKDIVLVTSVRHCLLITKYSRDSNAYLSDGSTLYVSLDQLCIFNSTFYVSPTEFFYVYYL